MFSRWLKKYNLLIFNEIDSTNSEAIRLARFNVEGEFVIWADKQTKGRGRYLRNWISESGNLFVSLLLNRKIINPLYNQLSFVAALALYDSIFKLFKDSKKKISLELKWPNDLLINNHKVAGILLESITINGNIYLIIGVGINIVSAPNNINKPVTSLVDYGINDINSGHLLSYFMEEFDKYFDIWQFSGFGIIRSIWLRHTTKVGNDISFTDGVRSINGKFADIDMYGNLALRNEEGKIEYFTSGEVWHS